MENELSECPAHEEIKPEIECNNEKGRTSRNQFVTVLESPRDLDDQKGPPKLSPNYSEVVSRNSRGETSEISEECSQTPLKKRRYEPTTSNSNNTNGCIDILLPATNSNNSISQQIPQNKEIIKNHFKCRFCSFNTNTEVAFTMHLLQHVTGQCNTKDQSQSASVNQVQDKDVSISENNCSTSTNSEISKNSISITITSPKNYSCNDKDLKKSIVDEILKKLGFVNDDNIEEGNTNNETRNKEANGELKNSTEKKNGEIKYTHKNNGETKTSPSLKTYARKSPNKSTPTKSPCYNLVVADTVETNIDNEPIADSNQLLIDPPTTEQFNDNMESTYHILKNVIHAQIDGSEDNESSYQFVPNNVKQEIDFESDYSLFSIETAHNEDDLVLTPPVEPTPARNSIKILSNVSSKKGESCSNQQPQPKFIEEDQDYQCFQNKVTMPTDKNYGRTRDFQCEFCPTRTAPAEIHFRSHYGMHFTKKGIQCPFCTYRSIKSNVVKHLFCHIPGKTFVCPLCHIVKSNKETLTDHIKIAHSKQLFGKHDAVCRSWYCGK